MTDFIRNMWPNATATNAVQVKTEVLPVNQIQVPPTPLAEEALLMEKQRVIKMEVLECSTTSDAGKAQRAVRRDVVNARRDKRKSMSACSSPAADVDFAVNNMPAEGSLSVNDKSKKMKTGLTTSATVSPEPVSAPITHNTDMIAIPTMPTPEMDPSGEERLRLMEAQLENLDPDSKESKKKRRLIRNRMSAQLHRERKKAYVGQLEDQLVDKERELKALQEKLQAMANESQQLKQKLSVIETTAPKEQLPLTQTVAPIAMTQLPKEDDAIVIKDEPLEIPTPMAIPATTLSDTWDYCLKGLEDAEMTDVGSSDLLSDFDQSFAAYDMGAYAELAAKAEELDQSQQHHEIHAAKKNLAMMMAVMFSVSFFGNSPFFFNLTSGSNFSSMFNANPPKEFSQMSIASRIVACLEKTSWKEFRDLSTWSTTGEETEAEDKDPATVAASPSAASDITDSSDSCDSPEQNASELTLGFETTDLIDEFEYPVDDAFAPALTDSSNWFGDDDFGQSDVDDDEDSETLFPASKTASMSLATSKSITSRLYSTLTNLWHEKNQVLLTVLNGNNEVTQRSVADLSKIQKGMASGNLFSMVGASDDKNATKALSDDQSVTFLYPMSAFNDPKPLDEVDALASDMMFLEVSCQMSAGASKM